VPSHSVAAPRLGEAALSFECRTLQVIRTNEGQPAGGNVVLGLVVHIHARDGVLNDRMHVDPAELAAIGRLGGTGYCTTHQRFDMPMGKAALSLDPKEIIASVHRGS
jgi:flavin reductase (DIM6/NTAB) family NADH-FMN oxidoreductase RutF